MAGEEGQVIGRVSVKVMPDTSKFRSETQRELTKIQKQLKELKVQLDIDNGDLNRLKKKLKDWAKGVSPLKIQVKPELLTGATTYINARLRAVSRPRTVTIIPKIDNTALAGVVTALAALSGARALHNIFDTLFDKLMNLDKAAPLIGTLTLAIAGLAGWGIAAASNLAALSAALASIAPAALTLPGIFGGMAIGLGVLVAALKDFNTVMPEVGAQLSVLQDRISANFWAAFKDPLQELIDTLLPQFSAGMAATATAMGGLMGSLAGSLEGALNGALAGMFADLNESIAIAATGADAFANIIKILGEVGAGYLPRLAQWFADIATQFSEWLTKVEGNGQLQGWIDTALVALGQLGQVLKNLGSIFAGIGQAAAAGGGAGLGAMADTLGRIAAVVNSPAFQTTLTSVFQTAHTMMSNIASGAGPQLQRLFESLAATFVELGPLIGSTLGVALGAIAGALADPGIQNGISALVGGMSAAISALAPAMAPLGAVIGLIAQVVGQLLVALGPIAAVLIEALATAFVAILPALMPVVDILGGALLQIVTALAPLLGLLGVVIGQILTAITPLLPVLINLIMSILTPLITIVMEIVMAVLPHLMSALTGLVSALTPVLNAVASFAGWLLDLLAPALIWVGEIILGSFVGIINGIKDVFEGVVDFVMGVWNTFAGLFAGDWDRMWNGIKSIFTGLWDIIVGAFGIFLNVGLLGAGKKVLSALKGAWNAAWKAVKSAAKAVWDAIKLAWDIFLKALKESPGKALTHIKNLFRDTMMSIQAGAQQAWLGIKEAFSDGVKGAVKFVKNLVRDVKNIFGKAKDLLLDAGRKIMDGLLDGIKAGIKKVKETLNGVTNLIPDWKGPADRDRVLLIDAGRLIMDGFVKGLESRYDVVRKSLHGLTKDVANTQFAIPGVTGGMSSRLAAALDGTSQEAIVQKILNYHAAPGSSLDSEEDLFAAAGRARMVGW